MKAKPPLQRRAFANEWEEIEYVYQKLLYWLYAREDSRRAMPYADRLASLLIAADSNGESIFGQECWSLIHEAKGDIAKAIEHRENEIRLMRQLHEVAATVAKNSIALERRDYDDLSDRLDLLATLYHDRGDLDKAIEVLRESKRLCESHGIVFDGEEVLDEYSAEKG